MGANFSAITGVVTSCKGLHVFFMGRDNNSVHINTGNSYQASVQAATFNNLLNLPNPLKELLENQSLLL